MRILLLLTFGGVILMWAVGCQQEQGVSAPTAVSTATPTIEATAVSTTWTKIEPSVQTRCARDTPYAFWVRQGDPQKLMIYFQGGGGCYDAATCGTVGSYDDAITSSDNPNATIGGIFDLDNPQNPFQGHTMLFIPYCTGDVHAGSQINSYTPANGEPFDIFHYGHTNASTALNWAYANVEHPESIFVTGCSAGAIGSILHTPHIIEQYPDSIVTQLGDSGGGLTAFLEWNIDADYGAGGNFPDWISGMEGELAQAFTISKFTTAVANHFPNYIFAQYNAFDDRTQRRYFVADGGEGTAFANALAASLQEIEESSPNFHAYTGAGERHCILKHPTLYEEEASGVRLLDWVTDLANQEPVASVRCETC